MSLSTNLKLVASKLTTKYGNTVTIKTTTDDGVYNPQTGGNGTSTTIEFTKKAVSKDITTSLLQSSGLPENEWGKVKMILTLGIDSETILIDNSYTINGVPVMKVVKIENEDTLIVLKIHCG